MMKNFNIKNNIIFNKEEEKLFKKYIEEYNELYEKILILCPNDFIQSLIKRVEITLKDKINGFPKSTKSKRNSKSRSKTVLSRHTSKKSVGKEDNHVSSKKMPENIDYENEDLLKWEEFPELNYARNYACFYVHNKYYLYVFFGYNQYRGNLDTIEKIDLRDSKNKWEIMKLMEMLISFVMKWKKQ